MTSEKRLSILLLEDEAMIAFDMETYLCDAGFAIAGSFPSCSTASEWLTASSPGVAVLDVRLRDGPCHGVARQLRARSIPIIVYSGMSYDPSTDASVFADVPWILKPCLPDDMVAHIVAAFAANRSQSNAGSSDAQPEVAVQHTVEEVSAPKRRVQLTKAQKREQMEIATRVAFEDANKRRAYNAQKTERLRALRLVSVEHEGGLHRP